MSYQCTVCGKDHEGFPAWGPALPDTAFAIPEPDRSARVDIDGDSCEIDGERLFVRGCLDIPIFESPEVFRFLAWVELTRDDATVFESLYDAEERAHVEPLNGRLDTALPGLEAACGTEVLLYLRNRLQRPQIRSAFVKGPLAQLLREGLSYQSACELDHKCRETA